MSADSNGPPAKDGGNASLVGISGAFKGKTVPISTRVLTFGRGAENGVVLTSHLASRRHCEIAPTSDKSRIIRDLDSRNGTFVNDLRITERTLNDGDRIEVGDSVFVFADSNKGERTDSPSSIGDPTFFSQLSTLRSVPTSGPVDPKDWSFQPYSEADPEQVVEISVREDEPLLSSARLSGDFLALLRIGSLLSSVTDGEELQRKLLEVFFEIVPADRGAILRTKPRTMEIGSAFGWNRLEQSNRITGLQVTLIDRALREQVAIYVNGLKLSADAPAALAALAVPLRAFGELHGAIYLDFVSGTGRFNELQLQLFSAVAELAAGALVRGSRVEGLEKENLQLREELDEGTGIVGEGPAVTQLRRQIRRAASTDVTVLIVGESGTGKELVARNLHRQSSRSQGPFVAINCAALADSLIEAELFGYEKGAFTGAEKTKPGKIEVADGGTLFLDEIGEMPMELQSRLLRVLQEREFERVGGTRPIQVDIRVVAATNQDLAAAREQSRFREDLYYRLNVLTIETPPLRRRREDIPSLAQFFLEKFSSHARTPIHGFDAAAMTCLERYEWPGNVREFANAVERAVVMSEGDIITTDDLPPGVVEFDPPEGKPIVRTDFQQAVLEYKRRLVLDAVRHSQGNISVAAKNLGLHPNNLHRLIRNLNLKSQVATITTR